MSKVCPHIETTIVVLEAFDVFEKLGYKCLECGEIVKTENK